MSTYSTLLFQFLDIPGLTNSLSFDYVTNSSTQSVDITWVDVGDRVATGEFEIATVSATASYESFVKYFYNDYNNPETEFTITEYDTNNMVGIQSNWSDISNLSVNNWNTSFTYSVYTTEEIELTSKNQISITLLDNPTAGDTIEFIYYPNWPSITGPETILLSFTGSTPSSTGEILIGATVGSTYDNLELYFNESYNDAGEWSTSFDDGTGLTAGGTQSFNITPTNLSSLVGSTSSGTTASYLRGDQIPSDQTSSTVLLRSTKFVYSLSPEDVKVARETLRFKNNILSGYVMGVSLVVDGSVIMTFSKKFNTVQGLIPDSQWVEVGINLSATIGNLFTSMQTYNYNPNIPVIFSYDGDPSNEIYIDVIMNIDDFLTPTITINWVDTIAYGPVYNTLEGSFDSCKFDIKVWEGNISSVPSTINWSVTKQLLSDDQTRLYLDFTRLSKIDFRQYIASYLSTSYVVNSPTKMAKWIEVTKNNQLYGVTTNSSSSIYFGLDGWTKTTSHNIPRVLLSGLTYVDQWGDQIRRYYHKDSYKRIFYKTDQHFGYMGTQGPNGSKVITDMEGDNTLTTQYLRSVIIPTVDNSDDYLGSPLVMSFNYFTGKYVNVIVELYEDCKYPLVDVIFKNRYGVLETLSMGKMSRKNLRVKKDDYLRSVVDINGSIDTTLHSKADFDVNGREEWVLNTGVIPEYMNDPLEDLFLSDEVYLYDRYSDTISGFNNNITFETTIISNTYPVIMTDTSFQRKRGYSDGPNNYTFKFESSHEKINTLI